MFFNVYVKQKTLWVKLNDFFSDQTQKQLRNVQSLFICEVSLPHGFYILNLHG